LLIHNPNAGGGGKGRRGTLDAARHIFAAGGIESELAEPPARATPRKSPSAPPPKAAAWSSPAAAMAPQ